MRLLAILLLAVCAHAAVVEGVILDEETGNPLARTQVNLIPLPGTQADITGVQTGPRGAFVILSVRPGWYVLRATRRGYAPAEDGQSKPGRPGHAFQVTIERTDFHEIHMAHLPAITGTVLDENGIGIPRWPVHIFTAQKPMHHIGQTQTDDRGEYRIGELDPGVYFLRSGLGPLEDESLVVATYSQSSPQLANAQSATARIGQTTQRVNIRPVKDRLFTLSGMFNPLTPGFATITLITDTGRTDIATADRARPFAAKNIQAGPVELIVKGDDGFGNECGSYTPLTVIDKDITTLRLACNPIHKDSIQISGAKPKSALIVRRVDLDGVGPAHVLGPDEVFTPGHWEVMVPPGDYYVASARTYGQPAPQSGPWYGFDASSNMQLSINLSTRVSTISGVVSTRGSAVVGAPILLVQTGSGQVWTARSDPQGNYAITNIGPGEYTISSSFEIDGTPRQKPETVYTTFGSTTVHALELILQ